MKNKLQAIKKAISELSEEEKRVLLDDLKIGYYGENKLLTEMFEKLETDKPAVCPHCGSHEIVAHGYRKGVRRLYCKSCKKDFSSTTGTVLYRIHKKDKWQSYIQCMKEGLTIRESASRVGISLQTSFNWRHKILSSLSKIQSEEFKGIVEADEFYLLESEKGNKNLKRSARKRGGSVKGNRGENKVGVLVTVDRDGDLQSNVVGKSIMNRKELEKALKGKIKPKSVLCTDSYKVYQGFAKRENIKHIEVTKNGKPTQKNKAYHIQTVNNLHKQIREFLFPFNGVSTKYLQNYLNWFLATKLKLNEIEKTRQWLWLTVAVSSALAYYIKIISNST